MAPSSPVSSITPSSGTSEDLDHREIQLALQDAKAAARNKIRSRFHSSSDLIHRLFVCISGKSSYFHLVALLSPHWSHSADIHHVFLCDAGVADQLQTNYASDLRSILKTLFEVMATKCELGDNDKQKGNKNLVCIIYYIAFHTIQNSLSATKIGCQELKLNYDKAQSRECLCWPR